MENIELNLLKSNVSVKLKIIKIFILSYLVIVCAQVSGCRGNSWVIVTRSH